MRMTLGPVECMSGDMLHVFICVCLWLIPTASFKGLVISVPWKLTLQKQNKDSDSKTNAELKHLALGSQGWESLRQII